MSAMLALVLGLLAGPTFAASLVVNTNAMSGPGSLANAIDTANANGEPDTITIGVTPVYSLSLLYDLPRVTASDTVIDATGTTAVITANGRNVFRFLNASNCTVRNFTIAGALYGVIMEGANDASPATNNRVQNMNISSSTWPVYFRFNDSSFVQGSAITSNTNGVFLHAADSNTIGGNTPALSNRIAGNTNAGVGAPNVAGILNSNNIIIGNIIGLNATGTAASANSTGVDMLRWTGTQVGGPGTGERNIISGNTLAGVWVRGAASINNVIRGNLIGTAEDGVTPIPNLLYGVIASSDAKDTTIGGNNAADANIIRGNVNGVVVTGVNTIRNRISRNSIFNNSTSGISLTSSGNTLLAAPSIPYPLAPVSGTAVEDGEVQLFVDSGNQGEIYVGSATATGGTFSTAVDLTTHEGKNLTATLTDLDGNTSAFSTGVFIDVTAPSGSFTVPVPVVSDENVVLAIGTPTDNFSALGQISMRFSNDETNWTAWEPMAGVKGWDLDQDLVDTTDGPRTVYMQLKDHRENISASITQTTFVDRTGPEGGLFLAPTVVTDPNVTLELLPEVTDNFSTPATIEMRFSNDGTSWSAWEPYAATKAWDLNLNVSPFDGLRTPRVQFRDEMDNLSLVYQDTVELDTTGPLVLGLVNIGPALITGTDPAVFQLIFSEPVLGIDTGANPVVDDFVFSTTDSLAGIVVTDITEDTPGTFTITVDPGTGSGFLSVDLVTTGGITDDHGNALVETANAGPVVIDRLKIDTQPVGGIPTEQIEGFSFSVAASENLGDLHYVWQKDGNPIGGAPDAPTYEIPIVALTDSGAYNVVVSDDFTSVESDVAILEVQVRIPAATGLGLAAMITALGGALAVQARRRK